MRSILVRFSRLRAGKASIVTNPDEPDQAEAPSAEERTTEDAAGAPAGERDLDDLLDDPDAASG